MSELFVKIGDVISVLDCKLEYKVVITSKLMKTIEGDWVVEYKTTVLVNLVTLYGMLN